MGQFDPASDLFRVDPQYQSLVRAAGLDARAVFDDPRIVAWRNLPDRQNCTLDVEDAPPTEGPDRQTGGGTVRLHLKRYAAVTTPVTPADVERDGHQLLVDADIPTAPLVAWGKLTDGRSFTLWLDLAGYMPGDKLVESGVPFGRLLHATADLAGKLHAGGLHHRDLYLCHFMARVGDASEPDVALIDVARVKRLPCWLTRRRWIVKDLAQFWYSTTKLGVSDAERRAWLERYAAARGDPRLAARLIGSIRRKVRAIARHDARLNVKQPTRNVSIPR